MRVTLPPFLSNQTLSPSPSTFKLCYKHPCWLFGQLWFSFKSKFESLKQFYCIRIYGANQVQFRCYDVLINPIIFMQISSSLRTATSTRAHHVFIGLAQVHGLGIQVAAASQRIYAPPHFFMFRCIYLFPLFSFRRPCFGCASLFGLWMFTQNVTLNHNRTAIRGCALIRLPRPTIVPELWLQGFHVLFILKMNHIHCTFLY